MITFSKKTELSVSALILLLVGIFPKHELVAASPIQEESAFAKRMMTMDRNQDGFLTVDELPKSVLAGIANADLNKDGKWTAQELSSVSRQAMQDRAKESAALTKPQAGGSRTARRRTGRGPARATSGPGSPLDSAQILKFALTFDLDKDSGLNQQELLRYAAALAGRRAQARQQREASSTDKQGTDSKANTDRSNNRSIPLPEAADRSQPAKEASGLKSRSKSKNDDPFGSGE
ncbi:MAG: hypothetical protein ABJZ55_09235 [Fuerstiella sp.]